MKKFREELNAKLSKNGGFTLVEMLIVVAIIAILIAVSIPLVNSSLEKAKKATDDANLRAAKAEATIIYLGEQADGKEADAFKTNMYYDIEAGTFTSTKKGYNKTKVDVSGTETEAGKACIQASIDTTAATDPTKNPVKVEWVSATT